MPGSFTRLGPTNENGETRSDQTGSIRMLRPAVCSSRLACPTNEMRQVLSSTRAGGRSLCALGAHAGQAARSRVVHQRSRSAVLLGGAPFGSKKRVPSKWSEAGPS